VPPNFFDAKCAASSKRLRNTDLEPIFVVVVVVVATPGKK